MPWRDLVTEVHRELEQRQNLGGSLEIEYNDNEIRIVIPDLLGFDSGETRLKSNSLELLAKLSRMLKRIPYDVNIEGHCDESELGLSGYKSNLKLSLARAEGVAEILIGHGMDENR